MWLNGSSGKAAGLYTLKRSIVRQEVTGSILGVPQYKFMIVRIKNSHS